MASATVVGKSSQPGSLGLTGWPREQERTADELADEERRVGGPGNRVGDLSGEGFPTPVGGVQPARDGQDTGEQQPAAHVFGEILQGQVAGCIKVDQGRVVAPG